MGQIDYLVIGHLSRDITPQGDMVGGTVAYAGCVAQVLGCNTAVLTSSAADFDGAPTLDGLQVVYTPAPATTTFENVYTPQGRQQKIHAVAAQLGVTHVPAAWRQVAIVHLGPIANEVDPALIHHFPHSIIGLTPQGWMRRWDENGRVYARPWDAAEATIPLATAVILSEEDLLDNDMLLQYRQWARLLVLTQGHDGCTVFQGSDARYFSAPAVNGVEFTGAGDIFAAAFLIKYRETEGDAFAAARFANEVAAQSVTQAGLPAKIKAIRRYLTTQAPGSDRKDCQE